MNSNTELKLRFAEKAFLNDSDIYEATGHYSLFRLDVSPEVKALFDGAVCASYVVATTLEQWQKESRAIIKTQDPKFKSFAPKKQDMARLMYVLGNLDTNKAIVYAIAAYALQKGGDSVQLLGSSNAFSVLNLDTHPPLKGIKMNAGDLEKAFASYQQVAAFFNTFV